MYGFLAPATGGWSLRREKASCRLFVKIGCNDRPLVVALEKLCPWFWRDCGGESGWRVHATGSPRTESRLTANGIAAQHGRRRGAPRAESGLTPNGRALPFGLQRRSQPPYPFLQFRHAYGVGHSDVFARAVAAEIYAWGEADACAV